ncbi:MAG TPA: DNA repair protein RecN [Capsulimonadaceae bacterium]|jgi:DNA repair protein RecN (Recombination protein N)
MLQELHIRNFALIEHVDLQFGRGLNLLTGETGAGKSILIDALGLVLGDRSSGADVIRTGADRAVVEAVFDISDAPPETRATITEAGLDTDDGDSLLYVARELSRSGKSQCRVNGRLCPVSTLRDICEHLVDVHGQHEHQSLLAADKHIDLLDNWLGKDALGLRAEVATLYATASSLRRDLERLTADARERARNLDLYRFQQQEIADAALKPGEEDELLGDRSRIANAEKLSAATGDAYTALADVALDGLNTAAAALHKAEMIDPGLADATSQLNEALAYADEARRFLRHYREEIEFSPERLEEIDDRLSLIHSLKRKYGDTVDEIIAYGSELTSKLDGLENQEAHEADLQAGIDRAERQLRDSSAKLSKLRRAGSERFAKGILAELAGLGMAATRFETSIEDQAPSAKGCDRIEFMLSPNPGEPLRPLAKIASGGETSRIMLAMKSVLARAAYVPTLIFDEIDVGVGGRTATVIGDKLSSLADLAQILCITHLPQIASRPAAAHFFIEKHADDGRTVVAVRHLSETGRVDEITRMLGGTPESRTVVEHAREMLQRA